MSAKVFSQSWRRVVERVMSIRLISLGLILSLLVISPHYIHTETPEFLFVGSYAQYKQEFSTGEIHELYWEIISEEVDIIEIEIRSHGLIFNFSDYSFSVVPGGGRMVVNRTTRIITGAYHTNGTEVTGYPVNEKIAFWILIATNESTPIDSMYESNEYPTLAGPLQFDCLMIERMCWKTENTYSTGNQMNRYYDHDTGIVLRIETNRTVFSTQISILETLNDTNITPLLGVRSGFSVELILLAAGIMGVGLIVIVLYIRRK